MTASNAGGAATATSAAIARVASGAPLNLIAPRIAGTARVGHELTVTIGTWIPPAISYRVEWQRSGHKRGTWRDIPSAGARTYSLTVADRGVFVRVLVTATNAFGHATVASAAVGRVGKSAHRH